ncbi:hypothetical protein [uncultured Clostridium sp.]|uniref:hypothetical protein n=1 Tax=uncultured Clostridium sp. TaxID=59620 RepID=UPI00260991A8|nr:hypothetical protein [uncultured Clostridium sp.]
MDSLSKKSNSNTILVVILIIVGIIAVGSALLTIPTKSYKLTFTNNTISINGWESININLDTVSHATLLNTSPNVISNDNGGSMDNKIFGHENLETYGDTACYVENSSGKSIYLDTTNGKYLIALENSNDTTTLYNEIIKAKPSL